MITSVKSRRGGARPGAGRKPKSADAVSPAGRFIYVISEVGVEATKIGVAKEPTKRLMSLQVGTWRQLALIDSFEAPTESLALDIERMAHEHLKPFHLRGEWFAVSPAHAVNAVASAFASFGSTAKSSRD